MRTAPESRKGTGGNHGESAASSRGARGQSMDVDVERAEERDQDSADKESEGEAGDGMGASVSTAAAGGGRAAGGEAALRSELKARKAVSKKRECIKRKEQRGLLRSIARNGRACCTRQDLVVAVSAYVQEDGTFDSEGKALELLAAWRLRVRESQSSAKLYKVIYIHTHTYIHTYIPQQQPGAGTRARASQT